MAVKSWLKLALDLSWAWAALSVLRAVYHPAGSYWTVINRLMQVCVDIFSFNLPHLMCLKVLFAAGIILFVEKLCLQWVAINFHQKALADRLAENQLGLKALDRLSNAPAMTTPKKSPYTKRGHKATGSTATFDLLSNSQPSPLGGETPLRNRQDIHPLDEPQSFLPKSNRLPKRKKKKMTSVIVDHVRSDLPCTLRLPIDLSD